MILKLKRSHFHLESFNSKLKDNKNSLPDPLLTQFLIYPSGEGIVPVDLIREDVLPGVDGRIPAEAH